MSFRAFYTLVLKVCWLCCGPIFYTVFNCKNCISFNSESSVTKAIKQFGKSRNLLNFSPVEKRFWEMVFIARGKMCTIVMR